MTQGLASELQKRPPSSHTECRTKLSIATRKGLERYPKSERYLARPFLALGNRKCQTV